MYRCEYPVHETDGFMPSKSTVFSPDTVNPVLNRHVELDYMYTQEDALTVS